MTPTKLGDKPIFLHNLGEGYLYKAHYESNMAEAYFIASPHGLIMHLSTNIVEFANILSEGEFFLKDFAEGKTYRHDLMASGLFIDTGLKITLQHPTHDAIYSIWKVKDFYNAEDQ